MIEYAPTTPRPTVPGLAEHALTVSMSTMPGHTMPTMSDYCAYASYAYAYYVTAHCAWAYVA